MMVVKEISRNGYNFSAKEEDEFLFPVLKNLNYEGKLM
jgi:hypothetical protein